MSSGIYEDLVLGARDVCSNCLRLVRVERLDPTRNGLDSDLESHLSRCQETTQVGYGPSEAMSESKGVFCECGTESARHRLWSGEDMDRDRFDDLIVQLAETLDRKGVSYDRVRYAGHAIQAFEDGEDPDAALSKGIDVGVAAEVA